MKMNKFRHISPLLLVLIVLIKFVFSKNCVGRGQCSCMFDTDSSVVDITSLGNNDLTPRFKDVTSQKDGNTYSYNPCYAFNEGQCRQAAVCTVQDGQEIVIGESTNNLWTFSEDLDTVVVTYVGGPSTVTVTQVNLVCDPEACTPSLSADGPQGLGTFQLTLRTICACPNGCDENGPKNCNTAPSSGSGTFVIGGGTIFLIVFISVPVVYLLGGMIFMKFVKQAKGSDVIPNKSFWIALPSNIKTGVLFVLRPVCRRSKTYENI